MVVVVAVVVKVGTLWMAGNGSLNPAGDDDDDDEELEMEQTSTDLSSGMSRHQVAIQRNTGLWRLWEAKSGSRRG